MKRILFLHAGAEMYGSDKVMFDLICNLDKSKYEPYVILPNDGYLVEALRQENIKVEIIPYPIIRRKYFNIKGILSYCINYQKYSRQLTVVAKREHIDIIHNNTSTVLEGCYISRKLKIPLIWVIHEIILRPKFVFKNISRVIAKFATSVVAVSNATKTHLEKTGYFKKTNIDVIYNGVDINRFNPNVDCNYLRKEWNIPKNAKVIGMLGRLNSWKGQSDFLTAVNMVLKDHKDTYAIMVGGTFAGEEWRKDELLKEISASPYHDRIIYSNYRTDSECIHKLFDVFVLPSTNPDPLPTVVLEAMATEKPIVGYSHGGICEMVKDNENGLLVAPRDTTALALAIKRLLDDETLNKKMGKKSLQRLQKNFSLAMYVNNFSKEYNKVLKK